MNAWRKTLTAAGRPQTRAEELLVETAPARRILHVDMDAFFASVEQKDDPTLRGRPLIVAGSEKARGVVAAASYEARAHGIRSAMPTSRALRLCPQVLRVPPRHERYHSISSEIADVLRSFTDRIEPLSLDESYLDLTECCLSRRTSLQTVAREVKQAVREKTGLTASAGGGPNKLVAKIASDLCKPDGLLVVAPARVRDFLHPLAIERLWGVGPVTARRLQAMGIRTIGDLATRDPRHVEGQLGRLGIELHGLALGIDERDVVTFHETRSISAETTFATDQGTREPVAAMIASLASEVAERLDHHGFAARTITLKIRYPDFTTVSRSCSFESRLLNASELTARALELLGRTEFPQRAIRLVGVGAAGLVDAERPVQLTLPFDSYCDAPRISPSPSASATPPREPSPSASATTPHEPSPSPSATTPHEPSPRLAQTAQT